MKIHSYNQDCGLNSPPHPKQIIGYFPAYKFDNNNNVTAYQNISLSITHLYYIAFGPTDLLNGNEPYQVFQNKLLIFNQTKANFNGNILLPADDNLIKLPPFANVLKGQYNSNDSATQNFISDLVKIINDYSFYGIDIDYPNKLPCFQFSNTIDSFFIPFLTDISNKLKQSKTSKILTVTAGQYPISGINSDIISFVNIQAFRLNINTTHFSAGLDDIQTIFDKWSKNIDRKKLILGIELGGIIEAMNFYSNNVVMDIFNQNFTISRNRSINFPLSIDENIKDPCDLSPYGRVSWNTLSAFLSSPCYKNINTNSQQWNYSFNNKSNQPYIYQTGSITQQSPTPTPTETIISPLTSLDKRQRQPLLPQTSLQSPQPTQSQQPQPQQPQPQPSQQPQPQQPQPQPSQQTQSYYVVFYEDFQSLSAKLGFMQKYDLAGIAISDITKDLQFANIILGNITPSTFTPPSSQSNVGVIIGSVIGTFIFISALVASGFILYRKHKTKMPDLLIDTNKQACSDTNHQIYSDMNCQVRSDTNNQIYSDTNNKVY
ncbi:4192_t:CDS:2 [Scutellospora calospora]|uniref:4192_t:CDS:1 n=1 Tax=Scutellospora calospora TaxID=85575 RepID=A0ACA9JU40_9GLOM|nr:4192_t:CDS:2 [Scutellospora calospora]